MVVLTTFADRDHVTAAIDAGAVGFILKDADPGALADAVRSAARGEAPLDPRAALALIDRRRDPTDPGGGAGAERAQAAGGSPTLTAREWEVLALIGEGLSNRLIARRLGIAEKTVKAHLTSIFSQIGVTDRVQAALWWSRHGGPDALVTEDPLGGPSPKDAGAGRPPRTVRSTESPHIPDRSHGQRPQASAADGLQRLGAQPFAELDDTRVLGGKQPREGSGLDRRQQVGDGHVVRGRRQGDDLVARR